jgi:predicted HicB family RNase H-like nuclease
VVKMKAPRTKEGTAITADVADALAAEAERGYDLSKARRRVGRPSLGAQGVSPRMSFRTTPDLYEAIHIRARAEERSVSDLAREAVESYLTRRA